MIVKDVTIVVSSATSDANTYGYVKQNLDSSSGGILCFSTSGATSSLTQSHRAFTVSDDNTVVIRIPQPQILAWFVDPVAKDQSGDYQKLPDTFLPAATGAPGAPTNGQIAAPVLTGMGSLAQPAQAAAVDDGQSSAPSQA